MNDPGLPPIQLIANLVVVTPADEVLLVRYDAENERWWLPGSDLGAEEHPDEAARRVLAEFPGVSVRSVTMAGVESFRGRRGWHMVFHYRVDADGQPEARVPARWFAVSDFPRTEHGKWERDVVHRVLRGAPSPQPSPRS